MEHENLEQVKELINRIADSYDLPTEEQVAEMCSLTKEDWSAEDLQEICCEYWSHNSLEETAYIMFHGEYPPVHEVVLLFGNISRALFWMTGQYMKNTVLEKEQ